jgi:hypothetical protein
MHDDRRSFLSQLLSTATAVLAAAGALFAPRAARAEAPKVYPEYGVKRPDPKKKPDAKKKPPDVAPEYGVKRPTKKAPRPAVKYGIRRPSKKEDE